MNVPVAVGMTSQRQMNKLIFVWKYGMEKKSKIL
jgi:hypothetical protein